MGNNTSRFDANLLQALNGSIKRPRVSIFYQLGMFVVTGAMILLPLIYIALIGLTGWGVYWYATRAGGALFGGGNFTHSGRGMILLLFLYACPLFIGVVMVLFMIKPLFAGRPARAQPYALNPGAEPLLYEFIAKVCTLVGAPFPKRIDLDCQLNASAGFRRGWLSLFGNDLVLTIGLPLVAGMNMREFAGVQAHEFGHFTQTLNRAKPSAMEM